MLLVIGSVAFSQKVVRLGGSQSSDVLGVLGWKAFSADSSATVYSDPFDISAYDSVDIWVADYSSWGNVNFNATLQGTPYAKNQATATTYLADASSYASLGTAVDSTSAKAEVMTYVGRLGTKGAAQAKLKLVGVGTPSATVNRTDSYINIYIVGIKRQFTGQR